MLHTNQKEKQERICSNPKCNELGVYPAPKSREQLREYLYFCINCIRDFNKSWNYFEGLNEDQFESEIRKVHWKYSELQSSMLQSNTILRWKEQGYGGYDM